VPRVVVGHLAPRDLVERGGFRHPVLADQDARHHPCQRPQGTGVHATRLPLPRCRQDRRRHCGLECAACAIEAREGLGIGALHERNAEEHPQRVVHAVVVVQVRPKTSRVGVRSRERGRSGGVDRQGHRQLRHRRDHRARCLCLPAHGEVHVVVKQIPASGTLAACIAKERCDVAERRISCGCRVADRLLGGPCGPPRHRVEIARIEKRLARCCAVSRCGEALSLLKASGCRAALPQRRKA